VKFAAPEFLYLLPIAWAFIVWALVHRARRRRALLERFTGAQPGEWAETGASRARVRWDAFYFALAGSALLVALARPVYFAPDNRDELQGVPYLVALDASRSMLANDAEPNRYLAATTALDRFFAEARNDQAGLITFAGVAYLNAPLTFDMTALRTILHYVNPQTLSDPGSSLGLAIDRAGRFFRSNSIPERTLILISDGEELDGQSITLARRLRRDEKLTIHTIGVGTPAGAQISGSRDNTGRPVISKLDESNLRRIANAGGGNYYRLGHNSDGLRRLREEVLRPLAEKMARNDLRNYHEAYHAPLAAAIIALLAKLAIGADRFVKRRPLPAILTTK